MAQASLCFNVYVQIRFFLNNTILYTYIIHLQNIHERMLYRTKTKNKSIILFLVVIIKSIKVKE